MKVKPSVKKICSKCRIIRRHGRVMVICTDPQAQAAPGLSASHSAPQPCRTKSGSRTPVGGRGPPGQGRGAVCQTSRARRRTARRWHDWLALTSRATSALEVALTYIYGIGRTRALETLEATGVSGDIRVTRSHRRRRGQAPRLDRRHLPGRR